MNKDLELPFEDKIQLYLDGELSKEAEVGMFAAIAASDSLRDLFRDMLSIREEVRNDHRAFVPAPMLTERVVTAVGLGLPAGLMTAPTIGVGTAPIVSGAITQSWITILGFISALLMAVVSGYYYNETTKYEAQIAKKGDNSSANISTTEIVTSSVNTPSLSQVLQQIVANATNIKAQPTERIIYKFVNSGTNTSNVAALNSIKEELKAAEYAKENLKNLLADKTRELQEAQFKLDRINGSLDAEKQRSELLTKEVQALKDNLATVEAIRNELLNEQSKAQQKQANENTKTTETKEVQPNDTAILDPISKKKFSLTLGLRGLTSQSYPNPQLIQASETDFLNNIAISSLINITDNFAVGVEGGRENFGLVFSEITAPNTTVYYEKNPALLWGGLAVQGRLNPIESMWGIRPYLRGVVGGAPIGILGKVLGGVEFPITPTFSMSLATEGTFLQYSLQQNAFSTRKFGVTYGVQMTIK
ncbi:MAG: hypothetical protein JNL36_06235 [Candidatus Kapabacteria bacterium]|nr:hypothetical protein [Candidatus Kapabacteria bacterium]